MSNENDTDLTMGSVSNHLRRLAIPAATGMLFHTLYNIVDIYFAGRLSTDSQAGMAIGYLTFFFLVSFGFGLNGAMASLVGNAIGRKDTKTSEELTIIGILFALFISITLIIFGLILGPFTLGLISETGAYQDFGLRYYFLLLIALPAFLIAYTCNGILQAQGDAVSMQRALIIAFLLNLVLNPLLIFGIPGFWSGLGFDGIALSTIFSQYFVMIFMLYKLINARIKINFSFESLRFNYKVLKEIFIQMLPPSLSFQMIIIGVLVMQYALKDFGSQAIAGHSVAMRLEQLILLPVLGMTHALLPLAAQNFGANKYDRVRQSFNLCLKVAIGSMVICYPIIWVFGESIVSLFTKNEDVINIGVIYLRIDGLILPVYALIFSINSFLQAVKRPYGVFFVGLFRQGFGIAFFIWIFISIYDFGILGVWLGASISVIIGGGLSLIIAYRVGRIEIGGLWLNTKVP